MHSSSRRKAPSVMDDLFAPPIISQPIMIHALPPLRSPGAGPAATFITVPGTFLP